MSSRVNYKQYIKSDEWKVKRESAIKNANGKCQLCGKDTSFFDVHHNSYKNLGNEPLSDIVALCSGCHKDYHFTKKLSRRSFKQEKKRVQREYIVKNMVYIGIIRKAFWNVFYNSRECPFGFSGEGQEQREHMEMYWEELVAEMNDLAK